MQSKHNPTCPSLTVPSSSPCSHLSISVLSIHSGPMSSRSCPRASHSPWPKSQSKNGRLTNNSQSNGGTTSPLKILKHLGPQISIAPLGIIKQETIDAMGSLVPKLLMIYDQSFLGSSSLLVNCHVNREAHSIMHAWLLPTPNVSLHHQPSPLPPYHSNLHQQDRHQECMPLCPPFSQDGTREHHHF